MTLPAMLTALKDMILMPQVFKRSGSDVVESLLKAYPALSRTEAEDLAAMDPEKLLLYTGSIFAAQGGILTRNFPLTLRLLRMIADIEHVEIPEPSEIAQAMHTMRPWKAIHSGVLLEGFPCYLESLALAESSRGVLSESARFEVAHAMLRKAPFDCVAPQEALDPALVELTVDELLACETRVLSSTAILQLNFDVPATRRVAVASPEKVLLPVRESAKTYCGARSADFVVSWMVVPEAIATMIEQARGGDPVLLSEYAELFLQSPEEDYSDVSAAFAGFLKLLSALVAMGAVRLDRR